MSKVKMLRFESFKPILRTGRLISRGSRVVYETEEPFNQITLPLDMADVITLCSGNYSVKQIIEKIYTKQKSVSFRNVSLTILNLKEQGFLENGEDLDDPEFSLFTYRHRKWFEKLFYPNFAFNFIKRIVFEQSFPMIFYFICVGVISSAIASIAFIEPNFFSQPFLWIKGSFAKGFWIFFATVSVLQLIKSFVKFCLLALRTGRVYNIKIEFSLFSIHPRIDHEGSHLIDRLNERSLYHLACALSYLLGALLLQYFSFWVGHGNLVLLTALGLTVWDLNPFFRSELNELIKSMQPFDKNNPWFLVQGGYSLDTPFMESHAYLKNIEFKSIYKLSWCVFVLIVLLKLHLETGPYIEYTLTNFQKPWSEKLASLYSAYVLVLLFGFSAFQLTYLAAASGFRSFLSFLKNVQMYFSIWSKKDNLEKDSLMDTISSIPVLSWFQEEVLNDIIDKSEFFLFKNGMILFNEGDDADSLFVLTSGQVRIFKNVAGNFRRIKVSTLKPISVFGESSLLEGQMRMAAAISKGESTLLKIPARHLKQHMDNQTIAFDIHSFRTSVLVDQFFHSSPIFGSMDQNSVQFLMSRGVVEESQYPKTIFHQGDHSNHFYLVIKGSVQVFVNDQKVNTIPQGGFFGEIGVIASISRTATVEANAGCVLLKIDSDSFWEFLTQNLEVALMIEAVGELRLKEGLEIHNHLKQAS